MRELGLPAGSMRTCGAIASRTAQPRGGVLNARAD